MGGQAAVADPELGENTPLIGPSTPTNIAGSLNVPLGDEEVPLEDIADWTRKEQLVAGLSAVSFVASAASMIITPAPLTLVSGTIGCGVSPYVALQQQKITSVQALQETNLRVEEEVQQLQGENKKLMKQVEDMNKTVESLKLQKEKLDTINSVRGQSVGELQNQLEELKGIYGRMKLSAQDTILDNLLEVAWACDENNDEILSDEEIENAILRLEKINGIDIDNERVREIIVQNGRDLDAIMELVKGLLRDDAPEGEKIFTYTK